MIKILLATHYFNTHRGGVEIAAHNIAANILKADKNISINWIAADCDILPEKIENLNFTPVESTNFIEKILPFPYPIPLPYGILKIWNNVKKSDIVHIHDFLYLLNLFTFIFAKIQKKKIIITQHIGFIPYKNPFLRFLLNFLNRTLGKFILTRADKTVFISKHVQKYFESFISQKSNFKFISNGVNTQIYKVFDYEMLAKLRSKYNIEGLTILFVGRFTEKKGLMIIQELAKYFKEINFVFAGWGSIKPDDWKLKNVKVISGLQGKEIADLYNIADALILPSYGEGFPLVVQEAVSCGLDLLISEEIFEGYPEISKVSSGIISNQISKLQDSINELEGFINNYQYSYQKRIELSNFASEHWAFEKITESYLKIIENNKN
jgi:glycosyltransferase involved in cell wall biosynthesis